MENEPATYCKPGRTLTLALLSGFLVCSSCVPSSAAAVEDTSTTDLSAGAIAASEKGHSVARVVSAGEPTGAGIEIFSRDYSKTTFIPFRLVAKEVGGSGDRVTALAFSEDGQFLAIEVSDDDVRSVVSVVDTRKDTPAAKPLLFGSEKTSSSPHWAPGGHLLFVTPVSYDLGDARDKGIVRYNADDGSTSTILEGFFIVGKDFYVTSDGVVAIAILENDKSKPYAAIIFKPFEKDAVRVIQARK